MKWSTVGTVALLFAVALAVVPELLPTGPSTSLDASGLLASGRFPLALGVIFLGGLLTSLTPCVYPLIPITVSVFGAKQAESRGKAILLTSAYVIGMGVVFATLGVVAALSGKVFGSVLGSNWFAWGLALFLCVLASSMFGAFEMALPSGLATKLNTVGGAGLFGAAHSLTLNPEAVAAAAQTDLDRAGIAKTAREEKLKARKAPDAAYDQRMERLYRQHILKEQPAEPVISLASLKSKGRPTDAKVDA